MQWIEFPFFVTWCQGILTYKKYIRWLNEEAASQPEWGRLVASQKAGRRVRWLMLYATDPQYQNTGVMG